MRRAAGGLPALLATLCLVLVGGLYWQLSRTPAVPAGASASATAPAAAEAAAPPLAVKVPAETEFAAISQRPLFSAARHPAPPPPVSSAPPPQVAPAPAPPAPVNLTLIGIITEPARSLALVKAPNATTVVTLAQGDNFNGWQVDKILADRIVLRSHATIQEILFPVQTDKNSRPSSPNAARGTPLPGQIGARK